MLDKTLHVGAVFLDLRKAFDTVDHQVLLRKLTYFNFSAETMEWFDSYLSNREQCVMVNPPLLKTQLVSHKDRSLDKGLLTLCSLIPTWRRSLDVGSPTLFDIYCFVR